MGKLQCEKCELYFDDMCKNRWSNKITNEGKTYYTEEYDVCFDCLMKDDLLIKCKMCNEIINEGFEVENKKKYVEYKENPSHYLSYRNNLGKIYFKMADSNEDKTVYVYDKKTNLGWYCSLCNEKEHYIKLPSEFMDWIIYYNDLHLFEPLGYKFMNSETNLQSGKSVMKVSSGMYTTKTKGRIWNKIDKREKEEKRIRGKNKVTNRNFLYASCD